MMDDSGPPGYATNGFNENLSLFQQGKCGMWIDATVAASFVTNPKDSTVADKVGFALAPDTGLGKRSNWLWAWALAIPAGTQKEAAASSSSSGQLRKITSSSLPRTKAGLTFLQAHVFLYENANYKKVPFAQMTWIRSCRLIQTTQPSNRALMSVFSSRRFPSLPVSRHEVSQEFSAAYAGQQTVEEALGKAQALTNEAMEAAGYR